MDSIDDVIRALPVFMRSDARDAIERDYGLRVAALRDALASALAVAWRYVDVHDREAVCALIAVEEEVRR